MSDHRPRSSESDSIKHKPDYQLLVCIGILVPFGLVMVYSSSFVEGFVYYENGFHYMTRQLFAATVGTVGLIVTQRIDYRSWRTYSLHLLALAFVLLVLRPAVSPGASASETPAPARLFLIFALFFCLLNLFPWTL